MGLALGSVDASIATAFWVLGFLAYRALVYVPLTAIVAGFYAASITLVGRLLVAAGQNSDMAIVLTTLVVVVIFTPVKNAVQSAVDRHFKIGAAAADPPNGVPVNPAEMLRKLAELRQMGILTPEEIEAKKLEILSRAWARDRP